MRIEIKHDEVKRGVVFVKTFYRVTLTVTFSEEEKFIIKQRRLEPYVLLDRDQPADVTKEQLPGKYNLRVGDILKGKDEYVLRTPLDAKAYAHTLEHEKLPRLKEFIGDNESVGQKRKWFEL